MNNPLEAVTQAVNSLVTALKLPDESAKANEVLGEMSFPQFSRLLPYRDYNQESGLFMNDTTMGFMLEAIPINGANESIVEALDHMLRTKLPRGVPFCIHLMSSQLVGDRIEYGLREFSWSGEQAERFNAITRAYYMNAAATQFPLPEGMNLPLTLRHYRVFISYCSPSKKKSRADILEMENLVKIIRASLQGASITTQAVDAQAFIDIVGEMINHNPDSLYPKRRQLDPYSDLNYQCVEDSFDLKVRADYLTLGLRENGRNSTARILNFHLARNPEIAFLWNMADNYSNLLNPELSISCPFILTLTLVVEDQVKTHSEANLKYMDLEKKSKTSYAKWFPSVEKEAKEWGELRQRLGSGQSSVVSYFLNITAFCKDNNETALEVEQDILNSFRKNGFELISPRFNHMRNFLTCLPFMAGKGLFKQLKEAGVVQRAESFNVANLMPLVADTARRHTGAYITITQNIVDFDSDKASSAARAAWGNSSYKIILKQSAKEFAKYNQLYPDQFLPLQRDMIGKFGAAKDQWFSSFLLQVENHSSWHRLFVDPLSRAMYSSDGPDFEFVQQKRKEGLSIHEAVWQLAWKKSGPEMASLEAWLEEHEKYRSVA
ncbi:TPA: TraC family protein [Escherichia coli]|nr:TraC family protein [Escherichia coli]